MTMDMSTLTYMATNAAADTTTDMNTSIPTRTATNVAADMTTDMSTLTHMATSAVADMITAMSMLMHTLTDIMCPVILLTVIAKSAIRMRNTAMCAAKAWLIAPAVCRMPTR